MEQELSLIKGSPVKVRFTPHLIPVSRGMVSTMYVRRTGTVSAEELRQVYGVFYKDEPFVTILPAGSFPDTAHVRGTNMCAVSVEVDERTDQIIIMSSLDNLVKGASGAAVQNMNLMTGLDETAGLHMQAMFP
jgi:N-acetyl-gamma-glutamyl-phosphate reductase